MKKKTETKVAASTKAAPVAATIPEANVPTGTPEVKEVPPNRDELEKEQAALKEKLQAVSQKLYSIDAPFISKARSLLLSLEATLKSAPSRQHVLNDSEVSSIITRLALPTTGASATKETTAQGDTITEITRASKSLSNDELLALISKDPNKPTRHKEIRDKTGWSITNVSLRLKALAEAKEIISEKAKTGAGSWCWQVS